MQSTLYGIGKLDLSVFASVALLLLFAAVIPCLVPARRAAWFAQSFSPLLTGSHNDPDFAKADVHDLRVTTRTNPTGGSIVFIDNFRNRGDTSKLPEIAPTASAYQAPAADATGVLSTHLTIGNLSLPHQGSLNVSVAEPRTVIVNLPWTDNASFESICTNVLFRRTLGAIDYWVCYGTAGDTGEVTLNRKVAGNAPAQIDFTYPSDETVKEITLDSGDGHLAKFLVMNIDLTKKTWLAHDKLYVGPSFVLEDGTVEFPLEGGKAIVYSAIGKFQIIQAPVTAPDLPALSNWTWRDASSEKSPDVNTTGWPQSQGPQAMESYDSFQNRYGWYRTNLHRDSDGTISLHFGGKYGSFVVFLNGKPASLDHLETKSGDITTGRVAREDDKVVVVLPQTATAEAVTIGKADILRRELSKTSNMPTGILNTLRETQIVDMLAYLISDGASNHVAFRPGPVANPGSK